MKSIRILALVALAACSGDAAAPTDSGTPGPELEGGTWQLDVSGLVVVGAEPGLADLVRLFFTQAVLVGMSDVDDQGFNLILGLGEDDSSPLVQDECSATLELDDVVLDGMSFSFGPQSATFEGALVDYTIAGMTLGGKISEDGDDLTEITLDGAIDLREVEVLGIGTAVELCGTLADLGVACTACSDGEALCADLQLEGVRALRVDLTLDVIQTVDPVACPTEE